MRTMRLGAGMVAGVLLAAVSSAQQPSTPQPEYPTKIAFVFVQKALASTDEGKIRLKQLDDWTKPRQQELEKLNKDLNDLQGELVSKQGVATDDVLADLNQKLIAKRREFEDKQRTAKRDLDEKQQALLKDIGGRLQEIITKYAQDNHYTAVFIFKPDDLAYLADSADITDTIVKLFNQRYPVKAAAQPTPAK